MKLKDLLPENLRAASDRVLVKIDPQEETTFAGGKLTIQYTAEEAEGRLATVINVGPGRRHPESGELITTTLKPGDRIILSGSSVGHPLPKQLADQVGEDYEFVHEDMVLAMVNEDPWLVTSRDAVVKVLGAGAWVALCSAQYDD